MIEPSEYLSPEFDAKLIKVGELRSILLQNDVPYSSIAKKIDLVKLFETNIKPRSAALLEQWNQVQPSDKGILDGESQQGNHLRELDTDSNENEEQQQQQGGRRKSKIKASGAGAARKSSAAAVVGIDSSGKGKGKGKARASVKGKGREMDNNNVEAAPPVPKRLKFRPTSSRTAVERESDSDSDSEDLDDEVESVSPQKRKQSIAQVEMSEPKRIKPTESRSQNQDRRQSLKYESGGESGFSDFNPFQSGGESSPNVKPIRRKSSMGPIRPRNSLAGPSNPSSARKSLPNPRPRSPSPVFYEDEPAPPQPPTPPHYVLPVVPPPRIQSSPPKPSTFTATLSTTATAMTKPKAGVKFMAPIATVSTPIAGDAMRRRLSHPGVTIQASPSQSTPEVPVTRKELRKTPAPNRILAPKRLPAPISPRVDKVKKTIRVDESPRSIVSGGRTISLFIILFISFIFWREETVAAGYCDTGSNSNARLEAKRHDEAISTTWSKTILTRLDSFHLRPTCTPCPDHARCSSAEFITCELDYVRTEHPFRFGGVLPLAPRCSPDTEKVVAVALQASRAAKVLRQRKGQVICGGIKSVRRKTGKSEAWVYGLTEEALLSGLDEKMLAENSRFDDEGHRHINLLALADLVSHEEVIHSQEGSETWYAAKVAEMPLMCRLRLGALQYALRYKLMILGLLSSVLSIVWLRSYFAGSKEDKEKVGELVGITLQQLRDQERLHYTDPVLAPSSNLAPLHLRDLVLQHEHSPARRQRLWSQVEKVVESNSNVRALQVERSGEEMRVWEWVGVSSGMKEQRRKGVRSGSGVSARESNGSGGASELYPRL